MAALVFACGNCPIQNEDGRYTVWSVMLHEIFCSSPNSCGSQSHLPSCFSPMLPRANPGGQESRWIETCGSSVVSRMDPDIRDVFSALSLRDASCALEYIVYLKVVQTHSVP